MSEKGETTDAGPVRGATDAGSSPLTAVTTLMEERRRYEGWIVGLDARRETTPPRVFARVHADYTSRLEAVVARLTSHVDGLRAELERLSAALEAATEAQQQARDARAESELRAHVGELSAADWEATARAADETIDALVSRHADLETELRRTRELLADAERPATPHLGSESIPDDAAAAAPSVPAVAAAPAAAGVAAPASDGAPRHADAPPAELSPTVPVEQAQLLLDGPSSSAAAPPPAGARRAGVASFDEMAFLNSVVDAPVGDASRAVPDVRTEVKAEAKPHVYRRDGAPGRGGTTGIQNPASAAGTSLLGKPSTDAHPMAENVSGNHPIVLREKPSESVKTLKCADCGSMNYPTEWYCEKCGAELASL